MWVRFAAQVMARGCWPGVGGMGLGDGAGGSLWPLADVSPMP